LHLKGLVDDGVTEGLLELILSFSFKSISSVLKRRHCSHGKSKAACRWVTPLNCSGDAEKSKFIADNLRGIHELCDVLVSSKGQEFMWIALMLQ